MTNFTEKENIRSKTKSMKETGFNSLWKDLLLSTLKIIKSLLKSTTLIMLNTARLLLNGKMAPYFYVNFKMELLMETEFLLKISPSIKLVSGKMEKENSGLISEKKPKP